MATLSRRLFLSGAALAGAATVARAQPSEETGAASVSVEEALRRRESIRAFSGEGFDEAELLRILWAAGGVNRPDVDGRTAPSWRTALDVDVYVAHEGGVGLYDPQAEAIEAVLDEDIRGSLSPQPFVGRAPAVLIYVSRRSRLAEATGIAAEEGGEAFAIAAHVDSAVMAQNVYLFCAAEGLGTCLVGGADRPAIAGALSFTEDDVVTYVQPVGRPA